MSREETLHELRKEKKVLDKIVDEPLADDTIHKILPKCPIILYNQLKEYSDIKQILPKVGSYCIILYLDSPNSGHWTAIMMPNEKEIEYWDSYGGSVDNPLKWSSAETKQQLGIDAPYLSNLLKESGKKIIWNKIKFQNDKDTDISTCGRYCISRIQAMKNRGMNLHQFQKMLQNVHKKLGMSYDQIISIIVSPEAE